MRSLLILLCLLLPSCAAVEVAERPEALALCTGADLATTGYAVHTGLAHEVNPVLSGSVNAHHFLKAIVTKGLVVGIAWYAYARWKEQSKYGIAAASGITCAVAANNGLVILKAIHP